MPLWLYRPQFFNFISNHPRCGYVCLVSHLGSLVPHLDQSDIPLLPYHSAKTTTDYETLNSCLSWTVISWKRTSLESDYLHDVSWNTCNELHCVIFVAIYLSRESRSRLHRHLLTKGQSIHQGDFRKKWLSAYEPIIHMKVHSYCFL